MNTNPITDITFAQIKGNYYWAQYGPFRVILDRSNGYINATQLCNLALTTNGQKKQFPHWRATSTADVLIDAIAADLVIARAGLLISVTIGDPYETRGTYAHPDLIPHILMIVWPRVMLPKYTTLRPTTSYIYSKG
jgi:hypothetical protein